MKAILTLAGAEIPGSDSLVYLDGRMSPVRWAEACRDHAARLAPIRGRQWASGANVYRDLLASPVHRVEFTLPGEAPRREFRLVAEIEVWAETPEEAAALAGDRLRRAPSIAFRIGSKIVESNPERAE